MKRIATKKANTVKAAFLKNFILSPIGLKRNPDVYYNNLKANNKGNIFMKKAIFAYKSLFSSNKGAL